MIDIHKNSTFRLDFLLRRARVIGNSYNSSRNCKSQYTSNCFKILDSAKTSYSLKLKEAFYINSLKPELNTQVQYFNTYLS